MNDREVVAFPVADALAIAPHWWCPQLGVEAEETQRTAVGLRITSLH